VICIDNFLTGAHRNIEHLLDHNYFEVIRHDVMLPLWWKSTRSIISRAGLADPNGRDRARTTCSSLALRPNAPHDLRLSYGYAELRAAILHLPHAFKQLKRGFWFQIMNQPCLC
jgi:hypothetical protein